MPSKPVNGEHRGWIIPIGGAEDKDTNPRILQRFVELSGGDQADIVVIPTASRLKESGNNYQELFRAMGAPRVEVLDFDTRRDCQEEGRLARLSEASGLFFTGGNQLRLSTILGGTHVARTIRLRNAQGVTVAGTSAGAGFTLGHGARQAAHGGIALHRLGEEARGEDALLIRGGCRDVGFRGHADLLKLAGRGPIDGWLRCGSSATRAAPGSSSPCGPTAPAGCWLSEVPVPPRPLVPLR